MDPSHRLPVEVIALALDRVSVRDIVNLMRLSRRWRAIARDHPLFWQNIMLDSVSDSALGLFSARIQHKGNNPISVTVFLAAAESAVAFASDALPLLASNLHRIERLHLCVHRDTESSTYFHLATSQALILRTFTLEFVGNAGVESGCAPLPRDLFAGNSPHLNDVVLKGIRFSDVSEWPLSFALVRTMRFTFDDLERHTLHLDTLLTLPSVFDFMVIGGIVPEEHVYSDNTVTVLRRLDSLILWVRTPTGFFSSYPTDNISFLETIDRTPDAVEALVSQLGMNLQLKILLLHDRLTFHIAYAPGGADSPVRVILDHLRWYDAGTYRPHPALQHPNLVIRVVRLTIHATLWHVLLPCTSPLPNCTELGLILETGMPRSNVALHTTLLPMLSVLTLSHCSADVLLLDILEARAFVLPWTERGPSQTLSLKLENIRVAVLYPERTLDWYVTSST